MFALLKTRRFLPLFITQFLGAFNDNVLKNALIILITYDLVSIAGHKPQLLVTIAAGLFILPFFLFSAIAGQLADKYDRALIARIVKIFEIIIMSLATIGFLLDNVWFLIFVLFATGVHSTFFGPIKYALLPQHLHPNELLTGNAYIEAGTFLAILCGTILGGVLIILGHGTWLVSVVLILVAILGYSSSTYIPKAQAPVPLLKVNYNIVHETSRLIQNMHKNKKVMHTILCVSWFWFIGSTFLAQMPTFVKTYLHAEASVVTIFLTIFSIGIAIGSLFCTKLLNGAIKSSYVPAASLGISLFIIDLYFCTLDPIFYNTHGLYSIQNFLHFNISWRIMLDLLFIAICGGIYIVPLYTIMQHSADKNYLARVIATNNIFNALFMVLSVLFTLIMLQMQRSIPEVFLIISILNLMLALLLRRWFHRNL